MTSSLSVIIICRDTPDRLADLLQSLDRAQPGADMEIIVVDDGSTPPIDQRVGRAWRNWPLTVHRPEGQQASRAAARNSGARLAKGDVLLFLDADQVAPPRLPAEHLRFHAGAGPAVVVGFRRHVAAVPPNWRPEVRTRVTNVLSQNFAAIASAWYLTFTCNLSVDAKTFTAVGGFDEGFVGWGLEDTEFGFRCRAHGVPILHNPHAYSLDHDHVVRTDGDRRAEWAANLDRLRRRHRCPETDALALLETYPEPGSRPPGQLWLESYLRFEAALREQQSWPARGGRQERALTVLDRADAAYARRLLDREPVLNIVDGLPGSGLDLDVQVRGLSGVQYRAMGTQ
jgi:GT2 family glycosyltransferase